eukprot:TRINITY_DN967_c0_g1_i9.p1 TRINITY_DN967_c0_g1~~TRINITY_DN967_c0_g1_i9.p1  ORF type:complete len:785 (-),score=137.10 TRINITY_DN967_c0_g1_i9:1323-3677(-)
MMMQQALRNVVDKFRPQPTDRAQTCLALTTQQQQQRACVDGIELLTGEDLWHTREGGPLRRRLHMSDGPCGVRGMGSTSNPSDCFPCSSAQAATFDPALVERVGTALGEECRRKGVDILLAPMVNIVRHPLSGRNFETFSEDPYLTGVLATAFIKGIQSQGAACCIKHFVCNDCEKCRFSATSDVSERALREVYCLPFEMAIADAKPLTLMTSYNKVNGVFSSENEHLRAILRDEWGFDGLVMSDWGGTNSEAVISTGLVDLEMPGPGHWLTPLRAEEALKAGTASQAAVQKHVSRLVDLAAKLDALQAELPPISRTADYIRSHRDLMFETATSSIVLLKNERDLVPICSEHFSARKRIALIGEPAKFVLPFRGGGGSGSVFTHHVVSPFTAIKERAKGIADVEYEVGCVFHFVPPCPPPDWFIPGNGSKDHGILLTFTDMQGKQLFETVVQYTHLHWGCDAALPSGVVAPFVCTLSGKFKPDHPGKYIFEMKGSGKTRIQLGDQELLPWTRKGSRKAETMVAPDADWQQFTFSLEQEASTPGDLVSGIWCEVECCPENMTLHSDALVADAVKLAEQADCAIVVAGVGSQFEKEGEDRRDLLLPGDQSTLIQRVAAANKNTIVVLLCGSAVDMSAWVNNVPVVFQAWYLGQETGSALAAVLFGDADPGGRLSVTIPRSLRDTPAFFNYPPVCDKILYNEGIFVGYRYFDKRGLNDRVLFPFGHGLSYTTFSFRLKTHHFFFFFLPWSDGAVLLWETLPARGTVTRPAGASRQRRIRRKARAHAT